MPDFSRAQVKLGNIPLLGVVVEQLSAALASGLVNGRIFYRTDLNKFRGIINGTERTLIDDSDSRLTDGRAPSGSAGGALAGSYPSPGLAQAAVTATAIAPALLESGTIIGGNTGTAAATDPALRKLGTGAQDAAAGNDSRLSDARTPTGSAGGALSGSYPSPSLAGQVVQPANINPSLWPQGYSYAGGTGSATDTTPAVRQLGFGSGVAMPGNAYLNQINAPSGPLSMGSQRITNLGTPLSGTEAATKDYVDNAIQGLDAKASVRVATTPSMSAYALNGMPPAVDGVSLAAGDRVLVKDLSSTSQNGIYVVQTVGTGNNGVWARASDMDTWAEVPGAFVFVEQGATYADTGWVSTADQGGTIGSTSITWTQFSSAGTVVAGSGLTKSGNTISANVDYVTLGISGGALQVLQNGITTNEIADGTIQTVDLADNAVVLNGTKVSGVLPVSRGGTGSSSLAGFRSTLGAPGIYRQLWTTAVVAGTWYTVSHNLNGLVMTQFLDASAGFPYPEVELDWRVTDANNIAFKADVAIAANTLQIIIVG